MFQSTLPVWGATQHLDTPPSRQSFQSTLPVWGATHRIAYCVQRVLVSIHAPRVGSDFIGQGAHLCPKVSIHAPRVGSDNKMKTYKLERKFQSTLPVWGATHRIAYCVQRVLVSIHAPRVGSDFIGQGAHLCPKVSIHAPRVGSDNKMKTYKLERKFQSTLPVWGATHRIAYCVQRVLVSIHAPRVGSDSM